MPYGPKPKPLVERFWPKVDKSGACWLWTGHTNGKCGYGLFMTVSPKKELAHRVSYELAYGPIPKGKKVLHSCDNPRCVCPDHLFVGTMRDNTADMVKKGRARYTKHVGGKNGWAKLTEAKVRQIRKRYLEGATQAALATRFAVSPATISGVLTRRVWAHVKG